MVGKLFVFNTVENWWWCYQDSLFLVSNIVRHSVILYCFSSLLEIFHQLSFLWVA